MVKLSASGLLQGLAESFGYLPIDLGASGHPPLCLASARLWVGFVKALGETSTREPLRGSWGFPWRFSSLLLYDTGVSYPPERAQRLIQMRYLLRALVAPLLRPGTTNFLELRQGEVRRIHLLRTPVNRRIEGIRSVLGN